MKGKLIKGGLIGVVLAVGGLLIAWSGIIPVGASSGHWAITDWFLHFTMRKSVRTYSIGYKQPPLDDPAKILLGAGHYVSACAPCHGAPGEERSILVKQMTPQPPHLTSKITKWETNELFWIVKHGVKYTGMPAWPTQKRDDEVWSMVAFLRRLPDMKPQTYQQLAFGETAEGQDEVHLNALSDNVRETIEGCARCHGYDGTGSDTGAFPRLTHMSEAYIHATLTGYANSERPSGVMQQAVAGLDDNQIRELSRYYANQNEITPSAIHSTNLDAQTRERGEEIVKQGIPHQGVPACDHCHGPDVVSDNPLFPKLAGQYEEYLITQLELWNKGDRGGTTYAHVMSAIGKKLKPDQIRVIAAYYSSLK